MLNKLNILTSTDNVDVLRHVNNEQFVGGWIFSIYALNYLGSFGVHHSMISEHFNEIFSLKDQPFTQVIVYDDLYLFCNSEKFISMNCYSTMINVLNTISK